MRLSNLVEGWFRWLTEVQHNTRSFASLRIIYGIGLLVFLVSNISDRSLIWGPGSFWVDPEAKRRGYITFDVLISKSDPLLFDIGFFALLALVVLFVVGFQTRLVTVLMLVMLVSLQSNNGYVLNGGDTLYRITLLFLVFANLGEHWSVDAWLRGRRLEGRPGSGRRSLLSVVPDFVRNAAHNAALVLCCFQIIIVYSVSGIWKLKGTDWPSGEALFYALRLDVFMAYPAINELLWQSSLLIYVATFIALWTQTLFPFAVMWRPTRIFVLVALVFMHLGIAVLLGLWSFSLVMIALDMLFIRDSSWAKVGRVFQSTKLWRSAETLRLRLGDRTLRRGARAMRH